MQMVARLGGLAVQRLQSSHLNLLNLPGVVKAAERKNTVNGQYITAKMFSTANDVQERRRTESHAPLDFLAALS